MKQKFVLFIITAVIFGAFIIGCSIAPGDKILIEQFGDKTLVYIIGNNGKDTETFAFNAAGDGGTWEVKEYTYGFPTAALETSGVYTDKEFFMEGGESGTFAYDTENFTIEITRKKTFRLKSGATTTYKDDYEWHTLTAAENPDAWKISRKTLLLTEDVLYESAFVTDRERVNIWTQIDNETEMDGDYEKRTYTYMMDIENKTFTEENHIISGISGAVPSEEFHEVTTSTYGITGVLLKGEETGDKELTDVWKKGNTVGLLCERTKEVELDYRGETAPEVPESVEDDGTKSTGTRGDNFALLDLNLSTRKFFIEYTNDEIIRNTSSFYYFILQRELK